MITRAMVFYFWAVQIAAGRETWKDESGEPQYTQMGEEAARHFGVMSDDGKTGTEEKIFDWAIEFWEIRGK